MLDGDEVVYLDQVDADNPVQVRDWTGVRIPAHMVSSGLVLLATVPPAQRDRYLAGPLDAATERTTSEPAALRRRLDAIAARGVEWAYEEYVPGINSVAAPIFGAGAQVVGALPRPRAVVPVPGAGYGGRDRRPGRRRGAPNQRPARRAARRRRALIGSPWPAWRSCR